MTTGEHDIATRTLSELRIDGYDRAVEIGRGGFAVVYRARRVAFAQDVAIKVLSGRIDETTAARFDRERQVLGALAQHPHIVTVYDSGTTATGSPFLVMEYLPGGPLSGRLAQRGPLGVREVVDIAVKLCGALETAHRTGILHRDIKPDNVLLSRYGEPVLADFGIARMRGALQTESGVVTATLSHAPPEVLDGHQPLPQSDVYSLASTLYALLAGSAPFVRDTDASISPLLARVLRDPVPDLRPRGVPDGVCALLEQAMAKDPAGRPRSALELGRAFQQVQRQHGEAVSGLVVEQVEGEPPGPANGRGATTVGPGPARTGSSAHASAPAVTSGPHATSGPYATSGPHPAGRSGGPGPTAPHGSLATRAVQPPPYGTGPQPPRYDRYAAHPGYGSGYGPPPAASPGPRRPRWMWPAVAGAGLVAAVVAAAVLVPGLGAGPDGVDPGTTGGQVPATAAPPVAGPGSAGGSGPAASTADELEPLLLQFTDFSPGGGELDSPPDGDIASVLFCSRTAPQDGKTAEVKRGIAPDEDYLVYTYLAAFRPGAAETFMTGLQETAVRCADSTTIDEPRPFSPPPGGDQAVRVTAQNREAIWVRHGDHVVEVLVSFNSGNDVDDATAPGIAARAVAKVMQGAS